MNANLSVDTTDLAIVDLLRQNGRATNQQIAETLGLTATTVSTRIRRMEDANQLRVVAVSDFAAHGYDLLLKINIDVEGRAASDVADDISELPEVFAVHLVTGRHDIDMLVALSEFGGLDHFLNESLAKVPGIRAMHPTLFVDILKYKFDVAPIESKE
jgi:Lrp/AsnC family transcriptional regulator, leucine-responsive regulatory protein